MLRTCLFFFVLGRSLVEMFAALAILLVLQGAAHEFFAIPVEADALTTLSTGGFLAIVFFLAAHGDLLRVTVHVGR